MEAAGTLAIVYIELNKFADAIPLLEEAIATFDGIGHRNLGYFLTQMLLGRALLGQRKYEAAETALLASYKGLTESCADIPSEVLNSELRQCIGQLVHLYEATSKKDKAAKWRAELDKYPVPAAKPKEPK